MQNINIEQTKYTPQVVLDYDKGVIEIRGDSLPENTIEFYQPLIDGVKEYFKAPQDKTIVNLKLTYFNSSSSKLLFDFFDLLEEASAQNTIVVNWLYNAENESMEEIGEEFKEDFEELTFNLVVDNG